MPEQLRPDNNMKMEAYYFDETIIAV